MGRLSRVTAPLLLGGLLGGLLAVLVVAPAPSRAGGGFADLHADATFGVDMTFSATWTGAPPDRVELLLGFGGEERLVVPVELVSGQLDYRRDLADGYVPPNTPVAYRWRAIIGAEVTVSPERSLLYDDDRPGLDWRQARIGSATVHWYDANETIARRFGDLAGDAADAAADLLGHPLAEPIDIFVYDAREDFQGAVGPGAREWIGAAAYPHLRTVYMWLEAGSTAYLDTTLAHEVTHVVFHDATANPFHEPASWLNEGVATWSEVGNAATERDLVSLEARSRGGLMAFAALTDQFPIDARGANLAYAQGATMVDLIIHDFGTDAMAAIAEAYRFGATDEDAVLAGTGVSFQALRDEYFAAFGVTEPDPVEPLPLGRSDVPIPPQAGVEPAPSAEPQPAPRESQDAAWWLIIGFVALGVVFVATVVVRSRRAPRPAGGGER
ncbi:MAG TPA: peptidase MA family metallohydrolase [Candidatus Limnocylindria bacterium]